MATLTIDPKKVRPLLGSTSTRGELGEASTVGRLLYLAADGTWYETAGDAEETCIGTIGVAVAGSRRATDGALAAGETVTILELGRCFFGEDVGLDPSKQYYVADVTDGESGLISDTPGTVKRRVGNPEGAGVFFVAPYAVNSDYPGGA